jgi:hypothetical protein
VRKAEKRIATHSFSSCFNLKVESGEPIELKEHRNHNLVLRRESMRKTVKKSEKLE